MVSWSTSAGRQRTRTMPSGQCARGCSWSRRSRDCNPMRMSGCKPGSGIATGPAVVGDLIGEGASREETVVGETPNLAARLQALAEPGAVVVAEGTRRLLGGLFAYRDLGAV